MLAGPDTTTDVSTGGAMMIVSARPLVTTKAPDVAVTLIVTLPGDTAVTRPDEETVARAVFELAHAKVAAIVEPFWSRGAAVNWSVSPVVTVCDEAEIATEVSTGGAALTAIRRVADSDAPPETDACAVIMTDPLATAVTSPP